MWGWQELGGCTLAEFYCEPKIAVKHSLLTEKKYFSAFQCYNILLKYCFYWMYFNFYDCYGQKATKPL